MNTKVKVEFFKYTGKWYSSFEFETELKCFQMPEIKKEAQGKREFIDRMDFTVEVNSINEIGWNKYLFSSDANK